MCFKFIKKSDNSLLIIKKTNLIGFSGTHNYTTLITFIDSNNRITEEVLEDVGTVKRKLEVWHGRQ